MGSGGLRIWGLGLGGLGLRALGWRVYQGFRIGGSLSRRGSEFGGS